MQKTSKLTTTVDVHVICQLASLFVLQCYKVLVFEKRSEKNCTIFKPREVESAGEWEIASAIQKATGACQRVIAAQGLWELPQWRFYDTGDIRACALHHSPPRLCTLPHPRHLPSVTGSSLSDNQHQPSIYTLLHLSMYHFVLCISLAGLWIPPFVIIQPRPSQRRDENQFFSSSPTSTDHIFDVKQKLLTSAVYTPSRTCMWTSGVHMKFRLIRVISITEAATQIRVCNPSQQEMKASHQLQTMMDAVLHPLNCPLLNP